MSFDMITPLLLLKIGILAIISLYAIFTFVILNQIQVMNRILHELHSSAVVQFIALLLIFLTVSLFFLALVIL